MKKRIGYIFWAMKGKDLEEKFFRKIAKKKGIELIEFNLSEGVDEKTIEEKAKKCDIIFNNSAEEFAIEIVKTLEALGKKVIEPSSTYYYLEDKWIFFLKCKENKIPTPETILLSENINLAKKELDKFSHWPIILKRIEGTCGNYVEKADNLKQAERIIKKFWKKGSERLPIIAQELILSPSYRITIIGNEIVQTAVKESTSWKKTGVYSTKFGKLKIDNELKKIVKKVIKSMNINICGIDLLKKYGKWVVLEVNATPSLDFFENPCEELVEKTINLLIKKINKSKRIHK